MVSKARAEGHSFEVPAKPVNPELLLAAIKKRAAQLARVYNRTKILATNYFIWRSCFAVKAASTASSMAAGPSSPLTAWSASSFTCCRFPFVTVMIGEFGFRSRKSRVISVRFLLNMKFEIINPSKDWFKKRSASSRDSALVTEYPAWMSACSLNNASS